MTGRKQREIDIVHAPLLAERQDMFGARAGHPRLEQTRSALGKNDLVMRRDVIAVRVRNKSEALRFPRIEPKVVRREINSVVVADFDHPKIYAMRSACKRWIGLSSR